MRITKEFDQRKQEIIDKSRILFYRKGYIKTSVADIVKEVAVAKGTFYYYFKSKEDVLDAIINQQIDSICNRAQMIVDDKDLSVHEKLFKIILTSDEVIDDQEKKDEKMDIEDIRETMHLKDNEKVHLKSITVTIKRLAPLLSQVIDEGNTQGLFKCPYPLEIIENLLVSSSYLFDEGIFQWEIEQLEKKMMAFIYLMEVGLGAAQGSLAYLLQAM